MITSSPWLLNGWWLLDIPCIYLLKVLESGFCCICHLLQPQAWLVLGKYSTVSQRFARWNRSGTMTSSVCSCSCMKSLSWVSVSHIWRPLVLFTSDIGLLQCCCAFQLFIMVTWQGRHTAYYFAASIPSLNNPWWFCNEWYLFGICF